MELVVPGTGNVPGLAAARRDKWAMAQAVHAAGIPDLRQFSSNDPDEIDAWLRETGLHGKRLVVKPVKSAGTDNVHIVPEGRKTAASWPNDSRYLDGTSYYWSTQDPWNNSRAGSALTELAGLVHADGKRWFAPFIAGYNKQLMGGTCVERRGTQTLAELWQLNSTTGPDGWFGISWNEFVENTYLEPSKRYGTMYLDALAALIKKGS